MSIRSTGGDLVPRDVAQVVAQGKQTSRGKKQRGGSLSRAFSWLKGKRKRKRKKKGSSNGQSRGGQAGDGLQQSRVPTKVSREAEDDAQAAGFTALQLFQKNVFVEGNRPQYLVNLHSEAQEGLKILQQEEKENGVDYQDGQSISSAVTLQPEEEASFEDMSSSLDSRSITADTMSMVSARSITSTRSAFTRQGSTFRPLNQGKHGRVERPRRKDRRTTVMGIPQHVQKELGLDRATWLPHTVDGQLPNGGSIPGSDGEDPASGRRESNVHLQAFEALHPSSAEQQLRHHIESTYRDGPYPSPLLKYRSLAAPAMTTDGFLQTPPSPVVSMSPQASYLSKIIPNAVLPPDVDVVEITRSRSRSSMRTLSKSSLVTASPAPSRASDRYSNYNRYELSSCGSTWSHSQSSDTIVSDSSTISSQGSGSTPRASRKELGKVGGTEGDGGQAADQVSGSTTISVNGISMSLIAKDKVRAKVSNDTEGLEKDRFVRSMSVTKTKRPPPPPHRTNSLHQDKFRHHSRNPVNQASILERTLLPSSGYPSQGATTPIKDDKPKTTKAFQSLLTSATPEPIHKGAPANGVQLPFAGSSITGMIPSKKVTSPSATIVLWELFDIPEPPKVAAPLSPPPETWVHNRHTLRLLCSLSTSRLAGLKKKQDSRSTQKREVVGNGTRAPLSGAESERTAVLAKSATEGAGHIQVAQKLEDSAVLKKEEASPVVQKMELAPVAKKSSPAVRKEAQGSSGTPRKRMFFLATQKKEKASPEVKEKEPMAQKGNRDKVVESLLVERMNVMLPAPEDRPPTAPLTHAPPFPPPPPAHHPPPPLSKPTSTSSASSLPFPPPVEQLLGPVFEGQDKLDFPAPPLTTRPLEGGIKLTTSLLGPPALGAPGNTKTSPWTFPALSEDVPPPPQQAPPPPPVSIPLAPTLNVLPEGIPAPPQQAPPPPPVTFPAAPPLNVLPEGIPAPPQQAPPPPPITIPPAPLFNVNPEGIPSPLQQAPPPPPVTIPPAPPLNINPKEVPSSLQQAPPPPPVTIPPAPPLNISPKENPSPLQQAPPPPPVTIPPAPPLNVPPAPPLLVQNKSPAGSKQQPSAAATERMEQKPLLRSKSTPIQKEAVALPMVTPSLLHMIRLRSVHPAGGSKSTDHEEGPQRPIDMSPLEALPAPTMTCSPPSAVQLNVSAAHTESTTPSAVITVSSTPTKTPTSYTVTTGPSAAKPVPPTTSETRMPTVSPPTVVASPPAARPAVKFASVATTPAFSKIAPVPSMVTLPPPAMEHGTPSTTPGPYATVAPQPAPKSAPPITLISPFIKSTEGSTASIMTATQSTTAPTATATQCNMSTVAAKLSVSTATVTATQSPTTPTATTAPSMRLQEAIRMKTAAMSSRDGPVARLNVRTSVSSSSSPRSPEGEDLHKSPASTASFIFSKKVTEIPSSTDVRSNLRKNLVTEGQQRSLKMPPPVSRKPTSHSPSSSGKPESSVEHGSLREPELTKEVGKVQPVDRQPLVKEDLGSTGDAAPADTIQVTPAVL